MSFLVQLKNLTHFLPKLLHKMSHNKDYKRMVRFLLGETSIKEYTTSLFVDTHMYISISVCVDIYTKYRFMNAFTMYIDSAFGSEAPTGIVCTSVYWFALLNLQLRMIIQMHVMLLVRGDEHFSEQCIQYYMHIFSICLYTMWENLSSDTDVQAEKMCQDPFLTVSNSN